MRTELRVRLRHDLGGALFLDPLALAVLVPFATFTSVLERALRPADVPGWVLANLLAFGVCAVLVVALRRATRTARTRGPLPIAATLAVGGVLGPLKMLTTERIALLLGLESAGVGSRAALVAQVLLLGVIEVPGVVLVRASLERFRLEHRLLVARTIDGLVADLPPHAEAGAVIDTLAALRTDLATAPPDSAARLVRSTVEDRLRPLIHRLWATSRPVASDLTVRGLLRAALRRPVTVVAAPVLVHLVVFLLFALRVAPLTVALPRVLYAAGAFALVLVVARRIASRVPDGVWGTVHLAVVVAAAVVLQAAGPLPITSLPGMSTPSAVLLLTGWTIFVLLGIVAASTALADRDAVRAHLLASLGPDRYAELSRAHVDATAARELADRLHADLQGALLVAAGRMDRLADDPVALQDEQARVAALLEDVVGPRSEGAPAPAERTLAARLDELATRWEGFLDIRIDLAESLTGPEGSGSTARDEVIARVVSEALTNAHRHGSARTIACHVDVVAGALRILVEDDGLGPRRGRRGVGSAHLDAVATGGWSRTLRPEGGTRLEVVLTGGAADRP